MTWLTRLLRKWHIPFCLLQSNIVVIFLHHNSLNDAYASTPLQHHFTHLKLKTYDGFKDPMQHMWRLPPSYMSIKPSTLLAVICFQVPSGERPLLGMPISRYEVFQALVSLEKILPSIFWLRLFLLLCLISCLASDNLMNLYVIMHHGLIRQLKKSLIF